MSSVVPTINAQKGSPKSNKAERPGANPNAGSVPRSQLSEAAVKQPQSTLSRVVRESEGKTAQGNSSAGYALTPGVATAVENGRLAAAERDLEMLKRAKDNMDCTVYSAQQGVSVLQAYFQEEKAKKEEKANARQRSTPRHY